MRYLTRKSFVQTLGVAGLGLGLMASAVGAPAAGAQELPPDIGVGLFQESGGALEEGELRDILITLLQEEGELPPLADDAAVNDVVIQRLQGAEVADAKRVLFQPAGDFSEKRAELYAEFTAALADELGIGDADEVDAAIRIAMMTVVDGRVEEGLLTQGQAEALKFLIATSDVPMPAMGHHGGPGRMFIAAHGPGGHDGPMRGVVRERISERVREERAADQDGRNASDERADEATSNDSQADEGNDG